MHRLLLFFGIIFIANVFADEGTTLVKEESCMPSSRIQENSTYKEPCCPKKVPCITCEGFLPNYYDLECNKDLFFYGDFLYWYAREENLSPCMTVQGVGGSTSGSSVTETLLASKQANQFSTKWDTGFRVGIGLNIPHDGWDIEANFTWYHNDKKQGFNVPTFGSSEFPFFPSNGEIALLDPWINPSMINHVFGEQLLQFDTVKSKWKLQFYQVDWDLGRKFWVSDAMALRAYTGARGGWFTTRFDNLATSRALFSDIFTNNSFSDQFKTSVWGAGFLAGLQPEWHFSKNFILFSNLDIALLWGKIRVRKKEDYTSFDPSGTEAINFQNSFLSRFYKMQTVLDLAVGLRWEETWYSRVRSYLDVGWEQHIWFDVNHRIKLGPHMFISTVGLTVNNGFQGYDELQGNLMMGGAVARLRIDF